MADTSDALLHWAVECGATVNQHLDLYGSGERGRGVFARADIKAGEELLRIPVELTINGRLEAQDDGTLGDFYRRFPKPISNVVRLTLTLVHELHVKGSASQWWPFLSFLQTTVEVDLPVVWSDDARNSLQGTSVFLRRPESASAESFTSLFDSVVLPIMAAGEELWPQHIRRPEIFLRCLTWVMSRSFQGELAFACDDGSCCPCLEPGLGGNVSEGKGPFMFPLFDQLNHSSLEDCRKTKLRFEGGAFVAKAEQDIAKGEEILHTYGDHSDGELLRTYGFVDGDKKHSNPNNYLLVTDQELLAACRLALETGTPPCGVDSNRIEVLKERKLLNPVYRVGCDGKLPVDLVSVVQALLMNSEEFREFENSGLQTLGTKFQTRGTYFADRVTACLLTVLAQTRRRYGDSVAETDGRSSQAAKVRLGELSVLRAAQSYLVTFLAPKTSGRRASARKPKAVARKKGESSGNGDASVETTAKRKVDSTKETLSASSAVERPCQKNAKLE